MIWANASSSPSWTRRISCCSSISRFSKLPGAAICCIPIGLLYQHFLSFLGGFEGKWAREWNFPPSESVNPGELSGLGSDHQGVPGREPGCLEEPGGRLCQEDF